ncbi:hypothetical protein EJ08DRAFT_706536 [Tothia fuscella]|uniref:Heterokaryon incompatibility domain-containing protein n=1 Tax=Tothia fuscella TaxID=1048955 RepID=A0A9P4NFX5_9PEZI|nr:hypothetical protein EJ08DRAFT_706536 [Tothia fuscella]
MSQIYSDAAQVLTWVGFAQDNSDRVIDFMHAANTRNATRDLPLDNRATYGLEFKRLMQQARMSQMELMAFFSRSYWTRVWVAQEVLLAKKWIIYCGSQELDSAALFNMIGKLRYNDKDTTAIIREVQWLEQKKVFQRNPQQKRYQSEILGMLAHLNCMDPRDRIYGMQALVAEDGRILIDYTLSPGELFWIVLPHFAPWGDAGTRDFLRNLGVKMEVTGFEQNYQGEGHEAFDKLFPSTNPATLFSLSLSIF